MAAARRVARRADLFEDLRERGEVERHVVLKQQQLEVQRHERALASCPCGGARGAAVLPRARARRSEGARHQRRTHACV